MATIFLLCISNIFMTFAWYGHLKYGHGWPLWKAILLSWGIALLEYCLAVPANRLGYGQFSFALLGMAAFFAFAFKAPGAVAR
jgi:uncharacterized protein (DUF486 family)